MGDICLLTVLVLCVLLGLMISNWLLLILIMEATLFLFIFFSFSSFSLSGGASAIKYYFSQSLGSILFFVVSSYVLMFESSENWILWVSLLMGVSLKLGAFPMHFWVLPVVGGLPYLVIWVLGCPMKVLPLYISYSLHVELSQSWLTLLFLIIGLSSMGVGLFLGISAFSMRCVLGASSISHTGWFLLALASFDLFFYFFLYALMLLTVCLSLESTQRTLPAIALLGMGGLPPFSVFTGKLLVICSCIQNNMPLVFIVGALLTSALSLLYYLKFAYWYYLSTSTKVGLPLVVVILLVLTSLTPLLLFSFFYSQVGISFLL